MCCLLLPSQKGKVYFGYIYGVFVFGLIGLWGVMNLMSTKGIDVYRTASVIGYCLLPIVLLAALSIPLDLTGALGIVLVPAAVLWCANAAALFFVVVLEADDQRWYAACLPLAMHPEDSNPVEPTDSTLYRLLAYPVMLFYFCFALIAIF